ncbi:MAG TPA: hypothetical protein VL335_01340 [Candidatus Paceibacterota bacterium]|jgi:hypothetical protein|nr:hypothetical protein [Candidatus Paceibacterota bacterium]
MDEQLVITPDVTRWKEDGVNFVVKAPVIGKTDTWRVLQSSLAHIGCWPKNNPRNTVKYLELTGPEIRKKCAAYEAEIAVNQMMTCGNETGRHGSRKLAPIRRSITQVPDVSAVKKQTARLQMIRQAHQRVFALQQQSSFA